MKSGHNLRFTHFCEIMQDRQFKDCSTKEERLLWLQSSTGQAVLSRRPRLRQLYQEGKMQLILVDPHWCNQLNEWLFIPTFEAHRFGFLSFPRSGGGFGRPVVNDSVEALQLSETQKLDLLIHGYVVLPGLISAELVSAALSQVDNPNLERIQQPNMRPPHGRRREQFQSDFTQNEAILNLFHMSDLRRIVSTFLYGVSDNNSGMMMTKAIASVHQAQVALRHPEIESISMFTRFLGSGSRGPLGGTRWHVDGLAQGKHSPFALLIGVALSDQLQEYSGNLCVFPGSHHTLQSFVQAFVENGFQTTGQAQGGEGPQHFEAWHDKPILPEPTQLLLKAGDVVLCHQKLAHRGGPNFSQDTRKMIYFRVHHREQVEHGDRTLHDLWLQMEGMRDVI